MSSGCGVPYFLTCLKILVPMDVGVHESKFGCWWGLAHHEVKLAVNGHIGVCIYELFKRGLPI